MVLPPHGCLGHAQEYILMCRTRITREHDQPVDKAAYWRSWLEDRRENKDHGHMVAVECAKRLNDLKHENDKLRSEIEAPIRVGT